MGEDGRGQEGFENGLAGHGAGAWAAASVRGGEGLVKVEVHDVDAEVAGSGLADERVHVGAVHVEQGALGVEDVGDLVDLGLEDADGGGVGEHEGGGVFVDHLFELGDVDHALGLDLRLATWYPQTAAVAGFVPWAESGMMIFLRGLPFALVVGADEQDAGELTVGASGGLESDGVHAGDLDEGVGEGAHDGEHALREGLGLVGVGFGDALEAGDELVDAAVVLHGAGAERVHAEVDGVVPGGHAGEVADELDLGELGHDAEVFAGDVAEELLGVDRGHVERGHAVGFFAGRGLFEDEVFVLVGVGGGFLRGADELGVMEFLRVTYVALRSKLAKITRLRPGAGESSFSSRGGEVSSANLVETGGEDSRIVDIVKAYSGLNERRPSDEDPRPSKMANDCSIRQLWRAVAACPHQSSQPDLGAQRMRYPTDKSS